MIMEYHYMVDLEASAAIGGEVPMSVQGTSLVLALPAHSPMVRVPSSGILFSAIDAAVGRVGLDLFTTFVTEFIRRLSAYRLRAVPEFYPDIQFGQRAIAVLQERPVLGLPLANAYRVLKGQAVQEGTRVRLESYPDPETGEFRHLSLIVEVPGITYDEARQLIQKLDLAVASSPFGEALVPDVYPS